MILISISIFTIEVKATRKKFHKHDHMKLLHSEHHYTLKRKHNLVKLHNEYIKKLHYYCHSSKQERCHFYVEKINATQDIFDMLDSHQEEIEAEIDSRI